MFSKVSGTIKVRNVQHNWWPRVQWPHMPLSFKKKVMPFIFWTWVFCLCVSTCACRVPSEVRRGYWIPGNSSYGGLGAAMWVLGTKPRSSWTAEPCHHSPPITHPLSFSETNMQGILMIMASKQGTAAVVFGVLPCSCDGLGHFEPSRMLSCSETVLLPSLQSSPG